MTWYDKTWDDWDDFFPDENQPDVNDILFGDFSTMDKHAQDLFVEAFFNNNDAAYIDLVEYMHDQYGIDFEDAFDWEDFREWYDSQ